MNTPRPLDDFTAKEIRDATYAAARLTPGMIMLVRPGTRLQQGISILSRSGLRRFRLWTCDGRDAIGGYLHLEPISRSEAL